MRRHSTAYAVMALAVMVAAALSAGHVNPAVAADTGNTGATYHAGPGEKVAIFAGGCFWCVDKFFEHVEGVREAVAGYTGGHVPNPTYHQVSSGNTGHVEAVKVFYDPDKVSYERLLEVYWHNIDPTDTGGQFCDRGSSYHDVIFYRNKAQKQAAIASKRALKNDPGAPSPILTPIKPASEFWPAEAYHQDYYRKNPLRYTFYVTACGRQARLEELWGQAAPEH